MEKKKISNTSQEVDLRLGKRDLYLPIKILEGLKHKVTIRHQHSKCSENNTCKEHLVHWRQQLFAELFPSYSDVLSNAQGMSPAFPPPPMTMLIFHGLQNQDLFIDRSHVSTLSGGKGGGAKNAAKEEHTLLI